ncbi:MAG: hypothetical protein ACOY90_16635 [Candidatus Zhuqueibacterota bacterium]
MSSRIVDLAEQLLQEEHDFIVPIKKIWLKLSLMGELDEIQFEEFLIILQRDNRFDVFDSHENVLFNEQIENLEQIGFFVGPRVMLKSRKPNRKELGDILLKKTSLIFENLKKAWNLRQEKDEDEEDQLLQALASTQKLLRTLKKEFPESLTEK